MSREPRESTSPASPSCSEKTAPISVCELQDHALSKEDHVREFLRKIDSLKKQLPFIPLLDLSGYDLGGPDFVALNSLLGDGHLRRLERLTLPEATSRPSNVEEIAVRYAADKLNLRPVSSRFRRLV